MEEIAAEIEIELDPQFVGFKGSDAPPWVKLAADLAWWQQTLAGYTALYIAEIVKEVARKRSRIHFLR
ncbi:hypothetical protein GW16_02350 [Xanthomonas arboricola pv. celebensis]|uniref:hypothetical protein n=1 Tax=Xanthomonas arboricola TaxID=56448 RepID=UPI0004D59F20|nr:hypothetical protein [Xanthomonas arboricola]KER88230.1 hypothetical protein GW16_02350 [Xanthomonas arboricola pv. celebensis]